MKYLILLLMLAFVFASCNQPKEQASKKAVYVAPDTTLIPTDDYGDLVKYGRNLLLNTSYYIGPNGVNGKYTGNKMNCTNCHQQAGTKPFSFNLMKSHERYPQYRARENKVLTLAERVNNCVMRPHSGVPLPYESKEMRAILCYLKWINEQVPKHEEMLGEKNLKITFLARAANPERGRLVYQSRCLRCHNSDGSGIPDVTKTKYLYPPLWGNESYQAGSSMHRVIKQAQWLKANMPHDSATWQNPVLSDDDALDVAAFVNDDRINQRKNPDAFDYPIAKYKAIDYGKGPYADTFPETQHKFGPYQPIVDYWKSNGLKPTY